MTNIERIAHWKRVKTRYTYEKNKQKNENCKIERVLLPCLLIALCLSACGKETEEDKQIAETGTDIVEVYKSAESNQKDEIEASDTTSQASEEADPKAYPVETMYTDEEHDLITYGGINYINYGKGGYHLTRITEEENQTTFTTEPDAYLLDNAEWDGPLQRTYIFSKKPNLVIDNYQEAIQYFSRISEYQTFRSYLENEEDGISAFYMALNGDKSYYLIALTGEEGFYYIETENDDNMGICLMSHHSENVEFEYGISQIECGQGYSAQLEKEINYSDWCVEYKVTSDLLNYTAKLQIINEGSTYNCTMNIEVMKGEGQKETNRMQWIYNGPTYYYVMYPNFTDVNEDGYLDFLGCTLSGGSFEWYTIFVWDTELGQYVQAVIKGEEDSVEPVEFANPSFQDGYLIQIYGDSITNIYQRYRWEGSKLILDEEDIDIYDEELGVWVDQEEG